jgi:hypothetical protein
MDNHRAPVPVDDRLIDRLVDGELPEIERRDVLRRLDMDPNGWRRCALAFLEGQSWREALAPHLDQAQPRPAALRADASLRRPNRWRRPTRWAGLAATIAAAFALGWASHGGATSAPPQPPLAKAALPIPQPPPAPPPPPPAKAIPVPASLEAVVKHWEQNGYRAEAHKRVVFLELKNGRRANVPIQEVRLRYIGNRTY